MKTFKLLLMPLLLASLVMLSSCSHRLIDFTVISSVSHQIPFDRGAGERTEGTDIAPFGLGVDIKDAVDDALQNAGTEYDVLIDGVLRQENYFFAQGFRVEGIAINSSEIEAQMGEEEFNEWLENQERVYKPDELDEEPEKD